jgi:hypothetical protein
MFLLSFNRSFYSSKSVNCRARIARRLTGESWLHSCLKEQVTSRQDLHEISPDLDLTGHEFYDCRLFQLVVSSTTF